jgi:UDP-N-acetyl-D-mannosaminuronic acid dehydrogenase
MQINEGLPGFLLAELAKRHQLAELTVGILGMAFKSESDDIRSSLSYKLKKLLRFQARQVVTTDPFVKDDPELLPQDEVIAKSDLLIVCVPHHAYLGLDFKGKPVLDIWNMDRKRGQPRTGP